ncbi:hypothetical protein Nepgr_003869 [Nepenthes gracilis]|uniref:Uncharacterized protein n=1 Tax=Nepenthes gracilis TaxID=150966 RepID=A0AAD3S0C0_NEPGR|nr:hypothetical protein Nepgr_003869 [Nepenthes gracilis]
MDHMSPMHREQLQAKDKPHHSSKYTSKDLHHPTSGPKLNANQHSKDGQRAKELHTHGLTYATTQANRIKRKSNTERKPTKGNFHSCRQSRNKLHPKQIVAKQQLQIQLREADQSRPEGQCKDLHHPTSDRN